MEAYNYKRFKSAGKPWHPRGYGVGYLLTVEGKTIYHAGDTDFIPEMKQLRNVDIDCFLQETSTLWITLKLPKLR